MRVHIKPSLCWSSHKKRQICSGILVNLQWKPRLTHGKTHTMQYILYYRSSIPGVSNIRPGGQNWPSRESDQSHWMPLGKKKEGNTFWTLNCVLICFATFPPWPFMWHQSNQVIYKQLKDRKNPVFLQSPTEISVLFRFLWWVWSKKNPKHFCQLTETFSFSFSILLHIYFLDFKSYWHIFFSLTILAFLYHV